MRRPWHRALTFAKRCEIGANRGPGRVFGVTADEAGANLPVEPGPWAAFKAIDLERGVPTPGLDASACLDDVEQHGFHVTDAHVRITDRFA
jgi:hypothetical protein